jgi:hypothetical protein
MKLLMVKGPLMVLQDRVSRISPLQVVVKTIGAQLAQRSTTKADLALALDAALL